MMKYIWIAALVGGTGLARTTSTSATGVAPMIKERPSIREGSRPGGMGHAAFFYFRSTGRSHRGGSFSSGK